MNTTTSTRKIILEGQKVTVPDTFPNQADIDALGAIDHYAAQDLARLAKVAPFAGLATKELCEYWEKIESEFRDAVGMSWQEALTSYQEMQNDAPAVIEDAYPRCLAPLCAEDRSMLERIYNKAPRFHPVSKEEYNEIFKGACVARRGGVDWKIWGTRVASAWPSGLIALIAFRAYSMPTAQVKGY